MTTTVFTCRSETTLEQAARLMWEHECGVLPVIDDQDRVVALVTDRDVCMGAYTQGRALAEVPVANSMSRTVVSCHPEDAIEQALRAMAGQRVRRLPVVDGSGKLLGMLSLGDVSRRVAAVRESRLRSNLSSKLAEAMAAICERRGAPDELQPTPPQGRPIESGTVARAGVRDR
jgi:CBS-domain-containing membrane protein